MNILITGATKGIGNVIAQNLEGNIFAVGRNIEALKTFPNYFQADISNKEDLIALGDYIEEKEINILINNAGIYYWENSDKLSYDIINQTINTN